jgi:hypothetical protein
VRPLTKGIVVAIIQVLIICSLGAKLLYDRHTRPQAWFKSARYDPNLPIRGRYLALQLELNDPRSSDEVQRRFGNPPQYQFMGYANECGSIVVQNETPAPQFDSGPTWPCDDLQFSRFHDNAGHLHLRLDEPVLLFIADAAKDPTSLARGEELWVLATVPKKGPPRPISLGIKKTCDSPIQPLAIN